MEAKSRMVHLFVQVAAYGGERAQIAATSQSLDLPIWYGVLLAAPRVMDRAKSKVMFGVVKHVSASHC